MNKLLIFALALSLLACSNSPFYAPNDKINYHLNDFTHPVTNGYLLSDSGNTLHLQTHYQTRFNYTKGLVIHFHGNSGNLTQTIEKVLWLIEQGYDVLVFDYSGYGRSTGLPSREALHADALSILRFTHTMDDYQQKILIGTSMGGAIISAALAASQLESHYDTLILDSTFDTYPNLGYDVAYKLPFGSIISLFAKLFISDNLSPAKEIKKLKRIPIIVFHCIQDSLIPIERSLLLYQEINTKKAYWPMTNCKHARTFTDRFPRHQKTLLSVIDSFNPTSDNEEAISKIKLNNIHFQ